MIKEQKNKTDFMISVVVGLVGIALLFITVKVLSELLIK